MGNKIRIKQIDLQGIISASGQVSLLSASNYVSFVTQLDATMSSDSELAAASSSISQSIYTINRTLGSGLISGSSQLTSSYDTRYVLSGSITQTTWDNIDGKPSGLVSQSTDLTPLTSKTGSYATTGSNQFDGNQTITGSIIATSNIQTVNGYVQTNLLYNGGPIEIRSFYQPLQINSNGAGTIVNDNTDISGSLRIAGSIFSNGIGLISGSSQLTSSYDSRYVLSGSITQTTWDNIANKPNNIVSSSSQITALGFISSSDSINSLNQYTASLQNAIEVSGIGTASVTTIRGDLNIEGTTTTVSASNLVIEDNFIYLNDNNQVTNPDLGIAGNYNDGTYAHTGIFSDASDNHTWKVFKGYTLEPSQSIDTNDGSFQLADFKANNIYGGIHATNGVVSGSAQITALGFISSSQTINTSSLATTGSNTFIGTETISGSLLLSGSFSYNGTPLQNGFAFAQPILTKILDNVSYTGASAWSASYTASGGAIIVRADITAYKASIERGTATLYRNGVSVASQTFFFNQTNTHTSLPPITYVSNAETGSHTYSIGVTNMLIDPQDYATITVLEYGNSAMFPTTIISGSSQLTSSFDTRYTLSGSVQPLPNGLISGSSQLSGTTIPNLSGSFTGSFRGNVTGTAAYSDLVKTLNSNTNQDYSLIFTTSGSNGYMQTYTDGVPGVLYNPSTNRLKSAYLQGEIEATNGVISGSSQLTSSFDTRYTLSGSVQPLPNGLISGSSQLTASYDTRYLLSGSSTSRVFASDNAPSSPTQGDLWWKTNDGNLYVYYDSYWIIATDTISALPNGLVSGSSQLPTLATTGSNTFTGTNTFNNIVTIGGSSGAEGGELRLAYAETGNTLTGSAASIDIYQNRLRIFEGGGNARGAHLDLSKLPAGVTGELMWKASGMVNAGTFVTLDNIKATVTSGSPYGLSIAAVSTTFSANISAYHAYTGGIAGTATNNQSITTTPTTSLFGWSFPAEGDGAYYTIVDKTNSRMYRITMMIGASYLNNFISIERLF